MGGHVSDCPPRGFAGAPGEWSGSADLVALTLDKGPELAQVASQQADISSAWTIRSALVRMLPIDLRLSDSPLGAIAAAILRMESQRVGIDLPALLALGGRTNLAIYAISLVAGLLPLRSLDSAWQGGAVALCVNNGGFALIGLLLIQLAAYLDPCNTDLQQRSRRHRHRAVAAALAFLLLIPLQGFASWRQVVDHDREQAQKRLAAERTFLEISEAVTSSSSVSQLAERLESLKAGRLGPQDVKRPLADLKDEVLAGIRAAWMRMGDQVNPLGAAEIWALAQESLRRMAMALVLAVFFAGASQLPGRQLSLLSSFNAALDQGVQRRLQARHERRRRREERQRLRNHLEAEALARQEQDAAPEPRLDFAPQTQDLLLHTFLLQVGEPLENAEAIVLPPGDPAESG